MLQYRQAVTSTQGLTRAAMAATERREDRQVQQIAKKSPQFGLQAGSSPARRAESLVIAHQL